MQGRIWFEGNPWPEGHPVSAFSWSLALDEAGIVCHLHLETAPYASEREPAEDEEVDDDWSAPIVWNNYHACTLSSTAWGNPGLRWDGEHPRDLCEPQELVDPSIAIADDISAQPLHVYLLGHDAVCGHHLRFAPDGRGQFDITWSGRIALVYAGDYEPRHRFRVSLTGVSLDRVTVPEGLDEAGARVLLDRHLTGCTLVWNPKERAFAPPTD